MDIVEVPFNKLLGIRRVDTQSGYLLQLDESPSYLNHLGTVHAGAQLSLAEATSAECLLHAFPDLANQAIAVVRRVEAKFKNPLQGKIRSRARISSEDAQKLLETLQARGKGFIPVTVEVVSADDRVGLVATFEWFVQRQAVN